MPYIKVVERKRFKKYYGSPTEMHVRIVLLVVMSSLFAGWFSIFVAEKINSFSSSPLASLDKEKIKEEYQQKYGDNWKEKILADYKQYMNK